ncbi:MAG: FAD-dependent oxidoreductase [Desulfobacterales bacterium]|nr:FAD-dependent oxidoreductase [Desulfobacterales bacterium]
MANALEALFKPIQIGNFKSKNRILMSAMSINFGVDDNGYVTDQLTQYLVERAKGGAGMTLVGGGNVHPAGMELPTLPKLWDDGCIAPLKVLTTEIKKYDAKIGIQIMHGGRQCYLPEKVGPSAIPAPAVVKGTVRALEIHEIKEAVESFGDAARRCYEAGFDFLELHGAHGYLVSQFLSKNSNIREDEYGGSFENRTRFLFEVIDDIKKKTAQDYPLGIRINGDDYMENGWGLEDSKKLAPLIEKKGVAYLHVSAGVYGSKELTIPSMYREQGCFVYLAKAIKKVVSIPVAAVGRIKDPKLAEKILQDGDADFIAMGRPLLADPYLPQKAKQGRFTEIRPCIGCCLGCIHAVLQREPGSCVVNPDVGREFRLNKKETSSSEKKDRVFNVLVVGAGPSGLACARHFALKGHKVTICEKKENHGGLLSLAAKAPGRDDLNDILEFFSNELNRLNVKIEFNTELSKELIEKINPDKVVLATGSMPDMPLVKGLFQSDMEILTCVDILEDDENQEDIKDNILVLGGGMSALLIADFLAEKGKNVVVLNRKSSYATEMSSNDRYYLRERLKENSVKLIKNVSIAKFLKNGVVFKANNEEQSLDNFDTVVIAEKMSPIREAAKLLKDSNIEFHYIGDAKLPRHLMYCISEAQEIIG